MILKPEHTPYHRVFGPVRWVLSNREVEGRSGGRCRGVGDAYARRRSVARTACWSLRSGVSPLKKCQRYVKPCVEHGGGHQLSRSRLTCNKQAIDGSTRVVEPQRQHHSRHIFQKQALGRRWIPQTDHFAINTSGGGPSPVCVCRRRTVGTQRQSFAFRARRRCSKCRSSSSLHPAFEGESRSPLTYRTYLDSVLVSIYVFRLEMDS